MKRILSLLCGLAIASGAATTHAQIDWAAGSPGTSGGSIEVTGNISLATGISAAQVAPTQASIDAGANGDYTISAWIKSRTAADGTWWFGTGNQGLHLGIANGGTLETGHWNNDSSGVTTVPVDTWVHVAHVYRANNLGGTQEIFYNGVSEGSVSSLGPPNFDNADLQIGSRNGTDGPAWDGCIDDVAIFTSALSGAQIGTLFNDSSQAVTLGAAAYYNFEDAQTGTTAANLVPNAGGLTGTDGSPALQELDGIGAELPPLANWASGAPGGTSGGAVEFDGDSDALVTGISANLVGGNRGAAGANGTDYTISMWVNSSQPDADGNASDGTWWFGNGNRGLHFGIENGNTLEVGHWSADSSGTTVVQANTWVHATYTFDADAGGVDADGNVLGMQSIYLNGVLESSTPNLAPLESNTDLQIGSRRGTTGPGWGGLVDDVAIFTSVLPQGDITAMFNDASQAVALGAAAYYNFEDNQTGTTALNLVDVATSGLTATNGDPAFQQLDGIGPAAADVGLIGDVDCSGVIDFLDIGPFIGVLSGGGFNDKADIDRSGVVDFLDIGPFIRLLSGA